MKHLLERWSQLEPCLCRQVQLREFIVRTIDSYTSIPFNDDLSERYLAWIQWAVQQALVTKGYDLMIEYTPEFGYRVEAGIYRGESDISMAEALLAAYLEVLSVNP